MKSIFSFLLLTLIGLTAYSQAPLLLKSKFKHTSDLSIFSKEKGSNDGISLSDTLSRDGEKVIRFIVKRSDSTIANGKRSELLLKPEHLQKADRWFAFSNYLPSNYIIDPQPEIVAQWHDVPDFDLGETWRSPPISLQTENGHWMLHVLYAKDKVNTNATISGHVTKDFGPYQTNIWNDWVFHIRFSWEDDGILDVWKNGVLIYSYHGPNSYNDENTPYFKFGLYKWVWIHPEVASKSTTTSREIFYSRIRVGDGTSSYEKISK